MVEWLGNSSFADAIVVGLVVLLLSILISSLRHRRGIHQLTASYERQVQMLQQAITDRNQEAHAQKNALADANRRLDSFAHQLEQRVQSLHATEAELARAQGAEQQVVTLQQEVTALQDNIETLRQESTKWQTKSVTLQQELDEKSVGLAQIENEAAQLQQRVNQLVRETEDQSATLVQVRADRDHELTLRQSITAEISALYHRLHNGITGITTEYPSPVDQPVAAHDAMDSDVPTVDPPETPSSLNLQPLTAITANGNKQMTEQKSGVNPSFAANLTEAQQSLVQFLAGRGITVTQIPSEESFDPVLNSLASFLGTHYESVKPLYQNIKRNMQIGDDFTLNLKEEPPRAISLICQFGRKLYDVAFLEQYRYLRSPQYLLRAKTTRLPTAQNFFSGLWLERFIMQEVQSAVNMLQGQNGSRPEFAYIANPRITLANEQEGELDLLCTINGQIYWIESKSGDYQQHISKYSMIARTLQLDEKHALMVLTDIPASRSAELTALFGMGVCALGEFKAQLLSSLQQELA